MHFLNVISYPVNECLHVEITPKTQLQPHVMNVLNFVQHKNHLFRKLDNSYTTDIISFDLMLSNSNDFRPLFMLAPLSSCLTLFVPVYTSIYIYTCMYRVECVFIVNVSIFTYSSIVWFSIRFTLCER